MGRNPVPLSSERLSLLGDVELDELRNGLLNIVERWEDALKAAPQDPSRQRKRERPLREMRQIMVMVLTETARRNAALKPASDRLLS
jgi:hypothetical protein